MFKDFVLEIGKGGPEDYINSYCEYGMDSTSFQLSARIVLVRRARKDSLWAAECYAPIWYHLAQSGQCTGQGVSSLLVWPPLARVFERVALGPSHSDWTQIVP